MFINGKKLNISPRANLREADLSWANLREVNLRGANLSKADLRGADLSGANLGWANLSKADLRGADLSGANLGGACLSWADLREADLSWADLREADLRGADLSKADLRGACLREADLREADLSWADLRGACLSGAKNVPYIAHNIIVPDGRLIVYKKVSNGIAILEIPVHALRSNGTGRKCRANEAVVVDCPPGAVSLHDPTFRYIKGSVIRPKEPFDTDRWNECASGIHFFLTRKEAEEYN